jgi:hypothetical protein
VYKPPALIVPHADAGHLMLHVTAALEVLVTVVVNCCVSEAPNSTLLGDMDTATDAGFGVGVGPTFDDVRAQQPARTRTVMRTASADARIITCLFIKASLVSGTDSDRVCKVDLDPGNRDHCSDLFAMVGDYAHKCGNAVDLGP